MGSLGDHDAHTKPMQDDPNPHFSYNDTQPFDSQTFPSSLPGEKGCNASTVQWVQSTVPFDDTFPVEDACETQLVDLGGETQVLDDPLCPEFMDTQLVQNTVRFDDTVPIEDEFETQVVDLGGETQVLDDPVCIEQMDTQLVDYFSSDGEGTDKTEVLSDSDGFSDDESQRRGKRESLDGERSWHTSLEHSENRVVEQPNENCSSRLNVSPKTPTSQVSQEPKRGSIARFTSVRAASLRVSGLAASRIALKGANSESSSPQANNQTSEGHAMKNNGSNTEAWKEVDQVFDTGRYNNEVKGLINLHDNKLGHSTVRKLFGEDYFVEDEELASSNDNTAGGREMHQLPTCDDGLAGLSYIDSQEPGESSQANAFACVQRVIEENKAMFDEFIVGKSSKGKATFVSATKGPQNLAKKTNDRGTNRKAGIFDWDDGLEDEGGGDIFCRRKEEFFGSLNLGQRSFMKPQKAKGKQLGGCSEYKGKLDVQNEMVIHSDSKIVLDNTKLNKTEPDVEMNVKKNLVNEFDEQSNIATTVGQLEAGLARNHRPQGLDVGFDTQMAAEAMEALLYGDGIANADANNVPGNSYSQKGSPGRKVKRSKQCSFSKDNDKEVAPRQSKKRKTIGAKSNKRPPISSQKHSEIVGNESDMGLVKTRRKRAKSDVQLSMTNKIKRADKKPSKIAEGHIESSLHDVHDGHHESALTGSCSVKKQSSPEEFVNLTPIAHRTRYSLVASQLKRAENVSRVCGEETNCTNEIGAHRRNEAGVGIDAAKVLDAKGKSSEVVSGQSGEHENFKSKLTATNNGMSFPRRRRSCRQKSGQLNGLVNLDAKSKASNQPVIAGKSTSMPKRPRSDAKTTSLADLNAKRKTRSSLSVGPDLSSFQNFEVESSLRSVDKSHSDDAVLSSTFIENEKKNSVDQMGAKEKLPDITKNSHSSPSTEHKVKVGSDNLPKGATDLSNSMCTSPANCTTPVNAASPVCIGNEYFKQSRKKRLSRSCLMREFSSLCAKELGPISAQKDSRKRRDLANVRVLLSHHLDEDIIKQQRKIVDRLKVSIASSITDATHFITDKFVRTRNMLEAIASGKPVVTHLWLENVGRANYYIDEQKYILRDVKKEKEFGFDMPVSLAHARQHPLLQGRRVLITPSIKPSKEIISGLVKAVCGQAMERVGRSTLKDDMVLEDLLVLSCEEDYEVCVPFLERGAAIYSSELLLNGIVTQKLEYERHQLFADHVKRTRSTIWMKKDGDGFVPVPKHK
ncbi:uncharacterized protein LOC110610339 isoform X2 [Manihot esculenta]|uniref:BRCT domain-containing protein n=2 Tax=Manihot esculenta TaxID=3983 RepID=A0A2C9WAJ0_MANES|nr:uncharacterized protein LOC110610339 isoform X2 [Manihot esculenta]OAY55932.1 hypothetical protein MANES_03G190200v8 [Manihot esculenta]